MAPTSGSDGAGRSGPAGANSRHQSSHRIASPNSASNKRGHEVEYLAFCCCFFGVVIPRSQLKVARLWVYTAACVGLHRAETCVGESPKMMSKLPHIPPHSTTLHHTSTTSTALSHHLPLPYHLPTVQNHVEVAVHGAADRGGTAASSPWFPGNRK